MSATRESGLTAAQARHVLATLRHVNELIDRALRPLAGADAGPLNAIHNDFSDAQSAALHETATALRHEIEANVRALRLPASSQPVSASWSMATAVRLALIALADMDAKHLSHYGEVADDAAKQLDRIRSNLEQKLDAVRAALDAGG